MKAELSASLRKAAHLEPSLRLLTGDLGYGLFDEFREEYPRQFLNCGVAEQNMVGVAAGLSSEGLLPIVYSIGNFLVLRAAEQIRNDIVAPGRPSLLVAAGAGFTYGAAGYSHHLTEDLAFLRSLPTLQVFTPALPSDVEPMMDQWLATLMPTYLRLDRPLAVHVETTEPFTRGQWRQLNEGETVGLFSIGSSLELSLETAALLKAANISSRIVDCNQLTGLDAESVSANLAGLSVIASIEEHSIRGGLGSLLAEELTARGSSTRLLRFGLGRPYAKRVGPPGYLRQQCGMTAEVIVDAVLAALNSTHWQFHSATQPSG